MMVPDAPRRKGNASPDRPPTIADAPDGDDAPYVVDPDTAAAPNGVLSVAMVTTPASVIGVQATDPPGYRLVQWLVDKPSRWWHVAVAVILVVGVVTIAASVMGTLIPNGRWVVGVGSLGVAVTSGAGLAIARHRRHRTPPASSDA